MWTEQCLFSIRAGPRSLQSRSLRRAETSGRPIAGLECSGRLLQCFWQLCPLRRFSLESLLPQHVFSSRCAIVHFLTSSRDPCHLLPGDMINAQSVCSSPAAMPKSISVIRLQTLIMFCNSLGLMSVATADLCRRQALRFTRKTIISPEWMTVEK